MIESLSASMGLAVGDPLFWMPLALMLLVTTLLLGLLLFDGIALGAGLLLPWVPSQARAGLLLAIAPWQRANERWLPLLLGVSVAAFPIAWSVMIELNEFLIEVRLWNTSAAPDVQEEVLHIRLWNTSAKPDRDDFSIHVRLWNTSAKPDIQEDIGHLVSDVLLTIRAQRRNYVTGSQISVTHFRVFRGRPPAARRWCSGWRPRTGASA